MLWAAGSLGGGERAQYFSSLMVTHTPACVVRESCPVHILLRRLQPTPECSWEEGYEAWSDGAGVALRSW